MKWAVILAGGNGSRLQPLTRLLAGDDRPKQFCRLFNGETLLSQTRARTALNVAPARTLCVVTRDHERYYRRELADMPVTQLVEQPRGRGTATAIAYALARVGRQDSKAIVGLFPADHHYEDTQTFSRTVDETYAAARRHPDRVFLMGTEPDSAEVEYGWIEPGATLEGGDNLLHVRRFWEKPTRGVADDLLTRGCLWNTFVMVGSLGAFRQLIHDAAPDLGRAFELVESFSSDEAAVVERVYDGLAPVDFSRDVLAPHTARVAVVRLPNIGWTDLGQPARVQTFLRTHGGAPANLSVAS
jgi:mannose-1-phosphate guanylyltransferase